MLVHILISIYLMFVSLKCRRFKEDGFVSRFSIFSERLLMQVVGCQSLNLTWKRISKYKQYWTFGVFNYSGLSLLTIILIRDHPY